jgi:hypothetical protein
MALPAEKPPLSPAAAGLTGMLSRLQARVQHVQHQCAGFSVSAKRRVARQKQQC